MGSEDAVSKPGFCLSAHSEGFLLPKVLGPWPAGVGRGGWGVSCREKIGSLGPGGLGRDFPVSRLFLILPSMLLGGCHLPALARGPTCHAAPSLPVKPSPAGWCPSCSSPYPHWPALWDLNAIWPPQLLPLALMISGTSPPPLAPQGTPLCCPPPPFFLYTLLNMLNRCLSPDPSY